MNKINRPTILPTALSTATFLWSGVFVLYFLAALLAYLAWCRISEAGKRLERPSVTVVETELFKCTLPTIAVRYSLEGERLTVFSHPSNTVPVMMLSAYRDPAVAYRAVDVNPLLGTINVGDGLEDIGIIDQLGVADAPDVIATDFVHIKPGLLAARSYFRYLSGEGLLYTFARGDTIYSLLVYWERGRENHEFTGEDMMQFFDCLELKTSLDRFERPVVDSSRITTESHSQTASAIGRERMLWRLFADRVATEPETALVAAIGHFRKQLELASSVLEEREILQSDDFKRYEKLLAQREAAVKEWFVLLDKYVAIGDSAAALKQAEFIQRHATLREESLDRRRASLIAAKLAASMNGGK